MKYNGAANQCDSGSGFGDGEVEDYTVNIQGLGSYPTSEFASDVVVYPTPVINEEFNIQLNTEATGLVTVRMVSSSGVFVFEMEELKGTELTKTINKDLVAGLYHLHVILGSTV